MDWTALALDRILRHLGSPPPASPRLGKYLLHREIARGGMGTVFEAEDIELKRRVALKVIREEERGPQDVLRLHREAVIAARLRHGNIVAVHEVGIARDAGGTPVHYIAMELVEGATFAEVLRRATVPREEKLRMLEEASRALGYAHRNGVVHRDVKPSNLLVDPAGRVAVTDFGLAHAEEGGARLTLSNAVLGTPQYMAPEQVRGDRASVGPPSDVYALGTILYEILADRLPFVASTPAGLYDRILHDDPPSPRSLHTGVERDLERVCLKAMEKEPLRRYRDAAEFAEDLARFRAGEPVLAKSASLLYRVRKRLAKRKAATLFTFALLAAVAGSIVYFFPKIEREREGRRGAEQKAAAARRAELRQLRMRAGTALRAALELRRAGRVAEMGPFLKETEEACAEAERVLSNHPEPPYLMGRMHRATMRNELAFRKQTEALRRDPRFVPALYERIVLNAGRYRRRALLGLTAAWREEGERFIRERSSPRGDVRRPALDRDPALRRILGETRADLRRLAAEPGPLTAGQRACAEGLTAWIQGDAARARSRLAAAGGDLVEALVALASLEQEANRFDDAIRVWTKGIESDAGYVPFLEGRALARLRSGHALVRGGKDPGDLFVRALEDLSAALRLAPERTDLHRCCGFVLLEEARRQQSPSATFERALKEFDVAVRALPRDPTAWRDRAAAKVHYALYLRRLNKDAEERFRSAAKDLDEAISRGAKGFQPWRARATIYLNWGYARQARARDPQREYRRALEDIETALGWDPSSGDLWTLRAEARTSLAMYRRQRLGRDAEAEFRRAVEEATRGARALPHGDWGWYVQGSAFLYLGMVLSRKPDAAAAAYRDAIAAFRRAIARNSRRWYAWSYLGDAETRLGFLEASQGRDPSPHLRSAIDSYEKALRLRPEMEPQLRAAIRRCQELLPP